MTRTVNLARSKARQGMLTRLAESPGRPLERYGNVAPREMAVRGSNPRTEPGVSADPFLNPVDQGFAGRYAPLIRTESAEVSVFRKTESTA